LPLTDPDARAELLQDAAIRIVIALCRSQHLAR
jgi:hypothetical protein